MEFFAFLQGVVNAVRRNAWQISSMAGTRVGRSVTVAFLFNRICGADDRTTGDRDVRHEPGTALIAANALLGDKVVTPRGQTLGTVTEVVLDTCCGRVAYVVITAGGFMGVGEQSFVVPWNALTADAAGRCFFLDADRAMLAGAPPQLDGSADLQWHRALHRYYRARPYWE